MPFGVALVVLLALGLLPGPSCGFFFKLEGKVCFADELGADHQPVHLHYRCPQLSSKKPTKGAAAAVASTSYYIKAVVLDPQENVIHEEMLRTIDGSFSFISTGEAGEYQFCFEPSAALSEAEGTFFLDIESAQNTDYSQVQSKQGLLKVDESLKVLRSQMAEIKAEMAYVKQRQEPFQRVSESTATRVWLSSVMQMFILAQITAWQIWMLKRFLMAKKLV
eukprot:RCo046378